MSSNIDLNKLRTPKVVDCNKCGKQIKKITIRADKLTDNRVGNYFLCDNCGAKYPFSVITEEGLQLLKKMNRIKSDIKKFPSMHKSLYFALQRTQINYQKEFSNHYTEEEVIND